MKAGVLFAQNDMRYVDFEEPALKSGCVKIRVRACGICGSDVPRVLGAEAHFYPIILGHEFSGDIVEVADDVSSHRVGDRVAGVPLAPCMRCADCQAGNYALCKHYSFIGSRQHGAFSEYVVIPAANAVPIGDDVSYIMGAMLEPASVALHGILKSGLRAGEDAAVLGTGNIGIFALQFARIFGAKSIAVCDILKERLDLSRSLGANAVFNTLDADFHAQIAAHGHGEGFPYVFETAGQPATIQLGFDLCKNAGTLCCIGTPHKDFSFTWKQWEKLNRKEMWITGTWMSYSAPFPGKEWSLSAHYFNTGALKLHESMIQEIVPLCDIADAFSAYSVPGKVKGKIIIEI